MSNVSTCPQEIICRRQYNLGKQFGARKFLKNYKFKKIRRQATDPHDVKIQQAQQLNPNQDSISNFNHQPEATDQRQNSSIQNDSLNLQILEQDQQIAQDNLEFLRQLGYKSATSANETSQDDKKNLQTGKPIVEDLLSQAKLQNFEQKFTIDQILQIFPYELDQFQIETIQQSSLGKSVVACAPTGAGKTSIAMGAALQTLLNGQRVIYTTPLKALSNQKYNEFKEVFGEFRVGLQTGDVVLNSSAQIVVMTTEIFRNQLYRRDSEAYMGVVQSVSSVGLVVLDEVHYLGDVDRGTVWEEVIINCPKTTQILAMSATVQNPQELGEWMDQVHGNCVTIQTNVRPVPLKFWYGYSQVVYQQSANTKRRSSDTVLDVTDSILKIEPLMDENKTNLNPLFQDGSLESIDDSQELEEESVQKLAKMKEPKISNLFFELQKREMLPAIYFLFSRANCDREAIALYEKKLRFVSQEEFQLIYEEICKLKQENPDSVREQMIEPMCAGIASHHAGCLPGWKNLTESLFQRGLIRVIFATETLAAGINMPARTTILSQLARYRDSQIQRLSNNELLQMAGRAGRRGFDTQGNCIMLFARHSLPKIAFKLLMHDPEPLESQFTATYGMVLNILYNRTMDNAKIFVEKSFMNYLVEIGQQSDKFGVKRKLGNLLGEIEELEEQLRLMERPVEKELEEKQKTVLQQSHKAARKEFSELIQRYNDDRGVIAMDTIQYLEVPFKVNVEVRKGGDNAMKTNQVSAICLKIISKDEIVLHERPPNQPRNILDLLRTDPKDYLVCLDASNKLYVTSPGCLCGIGNECQIDEKTVQKFYKQILELGKNYWNEMKGSMDGYFMDGNPETVQFLYTVNNREEFENIKLEKDRTDELEAAADRMTELGKKREELRKKPQKKNNKGRKNNFQKTDHKIDRLLEVIYTKKTQLQKLSKKSQHFSPAAENWREFTAVVSVLQELDALDENYKLRNLGMIARGIRGDHELFLAIVLTQPQLNKLSPPQLAAVLGALMAGPMLEYKSDIVCMYDTSEIIVQTVSSLGQLQEELLEIQKEFEVDRPILIDGRMCGVVEAWASGQTWEMIREGCNLDEGDVARLLMRTIDFMKQVIHVEQVWEGLRENCKIALKEMDRAPVSEIYF